MKIDKELERGYKKLAIICSVIVILTSPILFLYMSIIGIFIWLTLVIIGIRLSPMILNSYESFFKETEHVDDVFIYRLKSDNNIGFSIQSLGMNKGHFSLWKGEINPKVILVTTKKKGILDRILSTGFPDTGHYQDYFLFVDDFDSIEDTKKYIIDNYGDIELFETY